MLEHLRVSTPPDRTRDVVALLESCPGAASIAVLPGTSIRPAGDLVLADVARESMDELIDNLRELGVDQAGTISLDAVDTAISTAAREAEERAPGDGSDAVIWEEVVRRTSGESVLSWTYASFLTLATLLAAIAVVLDSPILVIGAMVVGPEFGPLAAIAVGVVLRRRRLLWQSVRTLVLGFVVAIAVVTLVALLARAVGWIDADTLSAPRPLTAFIWTPDKWSFVVAFVAGIAGVLSLTSAKSSALVGVFISVTTVPAAGNASVAIALGNAAELGGSAAQLGINVAAIVLAGLLTLGTQKLVWGRRTVRPARLREALNHRPH